MATSSHTPNHEHIADWFTAFFAMSDDGSSHEPYPKFYTSDAKLIMGDKVAVGHEEILRTREGMWSAVASRHHTFEYFVNEKLPNTFLLQGTVKYGFKDGREGSTEWVGKAVFADEGRDRRLDFYQVFLNAGKK